MKNKTIEILAEGNHLLPVGTKVKKYHNIGVLKGLSAEWKCGRSLDVDTKTYIYEVDFSDIEPLYPHKGMEVPDDGIEFADGDGKLIDIGSYGFAWHDNDNGRKWYVEYKYATDSNFELKRTLPKTITVCADCFKEICECKHESGWYRVLLEGDWIFRYYNKEVDKFATAKKFDAHIDKSYYSEINWTPQNPVPENKN
jgi:hypothetical protein